jgi:hypothetical protein
MQAMLLHGFFCYSPHLLFSHWRIALKVQMSNYLSFIMIADGPDEKANAPAGGILNGSVARING